MWFLKPHSPSFFPGDYFCLLNRCIMLSFFIVSWIIQFIGMSSWFSHKTHLNVNRCLSSTYQFVYFQSITLMVFWYSKRSILYLILEYDEPNPSLFSQSLILKICSKYFKIQCFNLRIAKWLKSLPILIFAYNSSTCGVHQF